MSRCATGLIRTMIGRTTAHSRRKRQRLKRLNGAKKTNCLVNCCEALLRNQPRASSHEHLAVKMRTQFVDVTGVKRRVLPREIHFPDDSVSRTQLGWLVFGEQSWSEKNQAD